MAYLQTCRCQGKIYSHLKSNLVYTQFVDSPVKGTLIYIDVKNFLCFSALKSIDFFFKMVKHRHFTAAKCLCYAIFFKKIGTYS